MAISKEDRILIKILRQEKGYNVQRFVKEFPNKRWSRPSLYRLIAKIDATGTATEKKRTGRPRTVRIDENINAVEELVLSQEDAPSTV